MFVRVEKPSQAQQLDCENSDVELFKALSICQSFVILWLCEVWYGNMLASHFPRKHPSDTKQQ